MTTPGPGETAGPPDLAAFAYREGGGDPEAIDLPLEFDGDLASFNLSSLLHMARNGQVGIRDRIGIRVPPHAIADTNGSVKIVDAESAAQYIDELDNGPDTPYTLNASLFDTAEQVSALGGELVLAPDLKIALFRSNLIQGPRAFDLLSTLVSNAGVTVSRHELLTTVWGEPLPSVDVLRAAVKRLRWQFGRAGKDVIKTVDREGFMFVDMQLPPAEER